ncbi:MAG: hypothetical protein AAF447_10180 [Myxococcota bacterium]
MIWSLLRGTEWSMLLDVVSPSFFEVLPAGRVAGAVKDLAGSMRSTRRAQEAREARGAALRMSGLPIVLDDDAQSLAKATPAGRDPDRQARGQRLLELYFHQLYAGEVTLLDLRPERSVALGETLRWDPGNLHVRWAEDFLPAMRDLYAGFYRDDEARFQSALEALDLVAAEDVFRRQFGDGDQRAVRFEVAAFRSTFHEAFLRCKEAGQQLHGDFVALGVYLATLYLHLEALGGTFDVRDAFERGSGGA